MKTIRNQTSRDLTIEETGQHVPSLSTVEVDDELAESLLEQEDVWGPAGEHPCPDCDFEAASQAGLTNHMKTHDEESD